MKKQQKNQKMSCLLLFSVVWFFIEMNEKPASFQAPNSILGPIPRDAGLFCIFFYFELV